MIEHVGFLQRLFTLVPQKLVGAILVVFVPLNIVVRGAFQVIDLICNPLFVRIHGINPNLLVGELRSVVEDSVVLVRLFRLPLGLVGLGPDLVAAFLCRIVLVQRVHIIRTSLA